MSCQQIKTAPAGECVLVADARGNVLIARSAALRCAGYDDAER